MELTKKCPWCGGELFRVYGAMNYPWDYSCSKCNGGWISVKDRLPEDEYECLVITKDGWYHIGWFCESIQQWVTDGIVRRDETITHWIKLPEPPKEETMQSNDLISRSALGISRCNPDVFNNRAYGEGWNACVAMIEAAPAVDVAPVVHGRWIYKERHRKSYRQYTGYDAIGDIHTVTVLEETDCKEPYCSECGAQAAESFMNYCPKCGARMDGGENND